MRFQYEHKHGQTVEQDVIEAESFTEAGEIAKTLYPKDDFISLLLLPE
jgi:hypothetical protein